MCLFDDYLNEDDACTPNIRFRRQFILQEYLQMVWILNPIKEIENQKNILKKWSFQMTKNINNCTSGEL